jgi:hypothetical protein
MHRKRLGRRMLRIWIFRHVPYPSAYDAERPLSNLNTKKHCYSIISSLPEVPPSGVGLGCAVSWTGVGAEGRPMEDRHGRSMANV